jgi:hypothetical protein
MPINQLIKHSNLSTEKAAVLRLAFENALRDLRLVDRTDALTEVVAEKIFEVSATGISDPQELARAVIKRLGLPNAR